MKDLSMEALSKQTGIPFKDSCKRCHGAIQDIPSSSLYVLYEKLPKDTCRSCYEKQLAVQEAIEEEMDAMFGGYAD